MQGKGHMPDPTRDGFAAPKTGTEIEKETKKASRAGRVRVRRGGDDALDDSQPEIVLLERKRR